MWSRLPTRKRQARALIQRARERHRVSPDRARDGHELDDVEPSLATHVLRHERLRPAEPLGQGVRGLISV